jgi:hypothetical protein
VCCEAGRLGGNGEREGSLLVKQGCGGTEYDCG